ncbi:tumor protein D53 isoform X4 [Python bivittatus]|uniref:Tumor protein D53 isoform X4 n=1 Tax=Python bivittatus TaxID=176946 RepID=A0A9F5IZC2_PYTBI|nr:tumor protein D53 isoform X4 [Python bivittatus]
MENTSLSIESEYIKNLQQQIYFLELEANFLREQTKKAINLQPLLASEMEHMLQKLQTLQCQADSLHLELKRKKSGLNMLKMERNQLNNQINMADGLLERQAFHETDEDTITDVDLTNMISEEEREELKVEVVKLEDEIATLRQVLAAKEKHLVEIKQKLGINLMNELKQNFSKSWHDVQTTTAYKKTQETLTQAGQKATAAISNVGTVISKKFGDMRSHSLGYSIRHSMSMPAMRNSPTFKSFEEKVETTVTSIKTKVGGTTHPGGSFEEVLSSTAHASARSPIAGTRLSETEEELHC